MKRKTVLLPGAQKDELTGHYRLEDYVSVPTVDTFGTWTMQECMPAEQTAELARWANDYERRKKLGIKRLKQVVAPPELFSHKG